MFILVSEDNNLLKQRSYFQKHTPIAFFQKFVLQLWSKFTGGGGGDPFTNVISKKLCSTSAWVRYCKFAADLQNNVLEEHLWRIVSAFYIICFGASKNILLTSFCNLQTRIERLINSTFWRFSLFCWSK